MSLQAFGIKWYFGIGLALPLAATNLPVEPRLPRPHVSSAFATLEIDQPADLTGRALRLVFPALGPASNPRRVELMRPEPRVFATNVLSPPSAGRDDRAWPAGWTATVDDEIVK